LAGEGRTLEWALPVPEPIPSPTAPLYRQYARIVCAWVESAGLDGSAYGTHSMRRTKAAQILPKLRAFIEHVKYRSADAPRDGTAARKLRKIQHCKLLI
jgi:hypothetical protein